MLVPYALTDMVKYNALETVIFAHRPIRPVTPCHRWENLFCEVDVGADKSVSFLFHVNSRQMKIYANEPTA